MGKRLIIAVVGAGLVVAFMMYRAIGANAKSVVTVNELLASAEQGQGIGRRENIRLGARVAEGPIEFSSSPRNQVTFTVKDIVDAKGTIPVVYYGLMPDTLKVGRDVIVEGDFDGQKFAAAQLMTQCPSKYEPPKPGKAGYSSK